MRGDFEKFARRERTLRGMALLAGATTAVVALLLAGTFYLFGATGWIETCLAVWVVASLTTAFIAAQGAA